ncbi:MAG: hypothetical protein R3B96_13020 [Pirellulaceae bacterium]
MNLMQWMGLARTLSIAAGDRDWCLAATNSHARWLRRDPGFARGQRVQIRDVIERVMPSTVVISDGVGSGSGVIVSEEGLVLCRPRSVDRWPFARGHIRRWTQGPGQAAGDESRRRRGDAATARAGPLAAVELAEAGGAKPGDWCVALGHPGGYQLGRTPPVRVGRVLANDPTVVLTDCALIGGTRGADRCLISRKPDWNP